MRTLFELDRIPLSSIHDDDNDDDDDDDDDDCESDGCGNADVGGSDDDVDGIVVLNSR